MLAVILLPYASFCTGMWGPPTQTLILKQEFVYFVKDCTEILVNLKAKTAVECAVSNFFEIKYMLKSILLYL